MHPRQSCASLIPQRNGAVTDFIFSHPGRKEENPSARKGPGACQDGRPCQDVSGGGGASRPGRRRRRRQEEEGAGAPCHASEAAGGTPSQARGD